jgi:ABC-type nitrate/sulfonate/bicarbonate transport system permease component
VATVAGLAIAATLAAILAGIGAAWRRANGPVMTLGVLVDSTPLIAVAPILIVFVGGGMTLHIIVSATACFFPLLMGMTRGFRAVERNGGRAVPRARRLALAALVKLALPSALPYIFSGFKIAAPLAVLGTLIAEWMGAERGVGIMMIYAMFSFDAPQVWMTIVAVCLMAIGGLRFLRGGRARLPALGGTRGGADMTSPVRTVDTPDWRALPTRGQRAEARLAAVRGFVLRVALGVGILVALWGGAIAPSTCPIFVAPGPVDTWLSFVAKADRLFGALGFTLTGVADRAGPRRGHRADAGRRLHALAPASRAFMPLVIGLGRCRFWPWRRF